MFEAFFYWTGVLFWAAIAALIGFVAFLLVEHAINSLRFLLRCLKVSGWRKDAGIRDFLVAWWDMARTQPDRVRFENGSVVYWPGFEEDPQDPYRTRKKRRVPKRGSFRFSGEPRGGGRDSRDDV